MQSEIIMSTEIQSRMTTPNKLGIVAIALALTSLYVDIFGGHVSAFSPAIMLYVMGFGAGLLAGIHGSRWWFTVPVTLVLIVVIGIWLGN